MELGELYAQCGRRGVEGIGEGKIADITIFDPEKAWKIDGDKFVGKSHNQPYNGRSVMGRVKYTIARGRLVYEDDK